MSVTTRSSDPANWSNPGSVLHAGPRTLIQFPSGGSVEVVVEINLFDVDDADRDFVFQVVDLVNSYHGAQK